MRKGERRMKRRKNARMVRKMGVGHLMMSIACLLSEKIGLDEKKQKGIFVAVHSALAGFD